MNLLALAMSLSVVISVMAVHKWTTQRPWDNVPATDVKATEQNNYDMIVPCNNGQMCEQPTGLIPHESYSILNRSWTVNDPQKDCPRLNVLDSMVSYDSFASSFQCQGEAGKSLFLDNVPDFVKNSHTDSSL